MNITFVLHSSKKLNKTPKIKQRSKTGKPAEAWQDTQLHGSWFALIFCLPLQASAAGSHGEKNLSSRPLVFSAFKHQHPSGAIVYQWFKAPLSQSVILMYVLLVSHIHQYTESSW